MVNKKTTSPLSKFKPISNDFEFREFPFYWVMQLGNRYTHKMETALKKANINITTWRVSMILRENGALSITEVATHAAARLPTITKTVYKMQEKGLVDIKPRESDGRVSIVTITDVGLETIQSIIKNTVKVFDDAFDGFTKAQLDELNTQLQTIFSNLSDTD
jgi:DNA-binding MarR family transcriptional regulator